MKNIVKISISGLAFTLEEDGYILLDKYLAQLKNYYAKQRNGMEVVEGIEERIAELLRERMSNPEEVVSTELIREVMAIMGKPEDIEEENTDQEAGDADGDRESTGRPDRKLYRNVDDRILGGVCSGLAAYFNVDTILFRILFFVALFFGSLGFWVYIVLWMVIPQAKTVAQKCEMRGESPDFLGIQERVKKGAEQVERGVRQAGRQAYRSIDREGAEVVNIIGRVIAFCVGVLLVLISVPILIVVPISFIFSASWFHGIWPQGFVQLVAFHGSGLWMCILAGLALLLPFVGMLSGGIMLIFGLKPKRFRPGLIIFTGWLISIIALVIMLIFASRPYHGGIEEARTEISVPMPSDTLYVRYVSTPEIPDKDIWVETNASEAFLAWFEGGRKNLRAVVYPRIRIVRVDSLQPMRIRLTGIASGRYMSEAHARAEESIPAYTLQDSLITLLPDVYSQSNKWQGNMSEVLIYLPKGKQVVLTSPYRHHFDRNAPTISKVTFKNVYAGPHRFHRNNWRERDRSRWDRKWERWDRRWDH